MALLLHFLDLCAAFAASRGMTESALSKRLLGSGRRLDEIRNGGEIGVRRLEKAIRDLESLRETIPEPRARDRAHAHRMMEGAA